MSAVLSYVISLVAIEAFPEGKTVTNTDDQASENCLLFCEGQSVRRFSITFSSLIRLSFVEL